MEPMFRGFRQLVVVAVFAAVIAYAAKEYTPPRVYSAKTYPARDEHDQEQVSVAADPYDTEDKAAIFVANYRERDLLPIFVVVTNDSDQPISLMGMKIEFVTVNRSKLRPATEEDLYRRLGHSIKRPDGARPYPIPLPRRGPKPSVNKEVVDEIDRAMFKAKAVEAHATQAGFVFFDVEGVANPLAGGKLFVSDLRTADGKDLWYFEIPMEKYLTYKPGSH